MQFLLMLNEPIFIILFAQCLCRLSRGSCKVNLSVRISFIAIALAAVCCILAPHVWGIVPTWPQLLLGAAIVLRQWATAEQWALCIPSHVLKKDQNG